VKAFVTGATGFIGGQLVRRLRNRGDDARRELGYAPHSLDEGLRQILSV
jgi:nucleoside-diphosphate-sugar epimerase